MKKISVISIFMIMAVGVMPSSYSAHPQSGTSKQQVVVTEAPAAVAKSPWSGRVTLEMGRAFQKKPRETMENITTVDVGRVLINDVKLSMRAQWRNVFQSDEGKEGSDRYLTPWDPSVALSKGSLLEVAGVKIGGELRSFIPATYVSRADGVDRNPHLGFYHSQITTMKEVGAWSFSTLHRVTHYNFQRALNEDNKSNARFRWLNEVAVACKVSELFSISSLVDFLTYETRKTSAEALPNTRLEWTSTVDAEPMKNLSVSAGVTLTAPEQTLSRYFENAQSRLGNTQGVLTISYSFL
ncbi:MAG: hypothetical protein HYY61_01490 [Deltaproteobacteria bacterium]|nr:hypothetical protein [Deltaproteobacteria bacterium]